jgi:hypothetical protein
VIVDPIDFLLDGAFDSLGGAPLPPAPTNVVALVADETRLAGGILIDLQPDDAACLTFIVPLDDAPIPITSSGDTINADGSVAGALTMTDGACGSDGEMSSTLVSGTLSLVSPAEGDTTGQLVLIPENAAENGLAETYDFTFTAQRRD